MKEIICHLVMNQRVGMAGLMGNCSTPVFYIFLLEMEFINGDVRRYSGDVTLLRLWSRYLKHTKYWSRNHNERLCDVWCECKYRCLAIVEGSVFHI